MSDQPVSEEAIDGFQRRYEAAGGGREGFRACAEWARKIFWAGMFEDAAKRAAMPPVADTFFLGSTWKANEK